MDFGGKIGKFTKIIGKIHGSRKKKRGQSRITGKIKDSNSRFTKKIKLNSRITEKIRGGQFTVHEENKTQFTVHSKNKSPITVHGNTSLRPSMFFQQLLNQHRQTCRMVTWIRRPPKLMTPIKPVLCYALLKWPRHQPHEVMN